MSPFKRQTRCDWSAIQNRKGKEEKKIRLTYLIYIQSAFSAKHSIGGYIIVYTYRSATPASPIIIDSEMVNIFLSLFRKCNLIGLTLFAFFDFFFLHQFVFAMCLVCLHSSTLSEHCIVRLSSKISQRKYKLIFRKMYQISSDGRERKRMQWLNELQKCWLSHIHCQRHWNHF